MASSAGELLKSASGSLLTVSDDAMEATGLSSDVVHAMAGCTDRSLEPSSRRLQGWRFIMVVRRQAATANRGGSVTAEDVDDNMASSHLCRFLGRL